MRGTCGHDNRDGAKFCDQCGLPLDAPARAAAPASYTPRHLVEKILNSRSALEGERKQVTVLFADVQGSMQLAEQVDPEAWHRIMDHFFAIMTEGVHRFEGTINQYTGDGVMALFGAPLDPDTRQRQLLDAARLFCARSEREPLVILIEDLHWIDAASEAFLAHLVRTLAGSRALLLLNFRPQYRAPWADHARYQQIALQPFAAAAVTELLRELLGADATVAPLAERIRAHTGGNPFFIEEMVLALAQNGALAGAKGAYRVTRPVAALAMPATVEAVLAARIDRLDERDKAVLQMAAVIGKRFAQPLLEAVADAGDVLPDVEGVGAALTALQEAELIFAEALYPTAEYAFRHPLTQEVAYAGTGEVGRGRAAARESIELARHSGGRISECPAHLADAETHTAAPTDRAAVEQALRHVQALIDETGARVFLPRLHAARAGLAEQLGDAAARQAEWERAQRAAAEMGMLGLAAQYARRSAAAGRR